MKISAAKSQRAHSGWQHWLWFPQWQKLLGSRPRSSVMKAVVLISKGLLGFYAEQATRKHGHPHHILILVDSSIPSCSQAFLDVSALLISGLSKTEADPSCSAPNGWGTWSHTSLSFYLGSGSTLWLWAMPVWKMEGSKQNVNVSPTLFAWWFLGFCSTVWLKLLELPQSYFCLWIANCCSLLKDGVIILLHHVGDIL